MKKYYVYILLCTDNTYYTGVTDDLETRFLYHQNGQNPNSYTYNKRPVVPEFLHVQQTSGWNCFLHRV